MALAARRRAHQKRCSSAERSHEVAPADDESAEAGGGEDGRLCV